MEQQTSFGAEAIRWDLSDLFKGIDDPAIGQVLSDVAAKATQFEATYKGRLAHLTTPELTEAYRALEALLTPLYKVSQYVGLVFATDTANEAVKALVAKVDEQESHISNSVLFFNLETAAFSPEQVAQHCADPGFLPYGYSLQMSVKTAQYNLSEKEEKMANLKDLTGSGAFKKLYEELTSSFQFEFEVDGKVQKMNGSQLRALRQHENPEVRRKAMALFFSRYDENQLILTHIFNNILKSYSIEKNLRGYSSAIAMRNTGHDLDDTTVQTLHEVTTASYPLVQRYYRLKKELLGLDEMTLADIYAPMPQASKKFSYEEAKTIVLDGFKAFDSEIYEMAKLMFDQNRIDAPVTPTKRGGAFCSSSTPDVKPYVLLNFLGRSRDVSTMAHELGHAIHDMLCEKQSLFNYHPILPLAETASVFAEMIITDKLLKEETDPLVKQAILTDKLEDIFATSHRQNMFSKFEMAAHNAIEGDWQSPEKWCEHYKAQLKDMFGDAVAQPAEYQWEWSSIPHIFEWPFYVYAYNFGNLLVMALYQQYLEEGEAFIPKYKALLAMGSSASPVQITAIVGADITQAAFWQKSLNYIEGLIDQLERLVKGEPDPVVEETAVSQDAAAVAVAQDAHPLPGQMMLF
ncbi:MAG: M3 family oligoendopeptidase [Candidatus Margulisiibacteriota bacterium]